MLAEPPAAAIKCEQASVLTIRITMQQLPSIAVVGPASTSRAQALPFALAQFFVWQRVCLYSIHP
jgi:hypothetical protein